MASDPFPIIDILVQLMTFLLSLLPLLFLGVQSTEPAPPAMLPTVAPPAIEEDASMNRQPILIDGVELIVLESDPVQLTLDIRGSVQDGCQFPVLVEQTRDDNTITVEIYRELPQDVFCPMMIQDYNEQISLEGNFPPGEYVIRVNDFEITFDPSE